MEQWYYAQGRDKCGPIERSQLVEFLKTGVITPGALVWTNSMSEWTPAIQVPGLMGGDTPTPAPAVSAPSVVDRVDDSSAVSATFGDSIPAGAAPWEQLEATANVRTPQAQQEQSETPAVEAAAGGLTFSGKRRKPKHLRAGAKLKNLIVRVAALVIAVGILGGGGYVGAQYFGFLDEPVPPRLRYLPDNPDFVMTLNVPKLMSVAQLISAESGSLDVDRVMNGVSMTGLPLNPASVQDITVAGNAKEKRWVMVATLTQEIEIEKLFPGGKSPDTARVGGTKIYYNRDMADFGLDFAIALPTKSTLIVGPFETLKGVLKRRGAPVLAEGFMPLLEKRNSEAWIAGAADVDALWRMSEEGGVPIEMTDEQRWLAESIGSVSFTVTGSHEFDFRLTAQCKNAKDAPLLVAKAKEAIAEQRTQMLEMIHSFGQRVTENTKTPLDDVKITSDANGMLTIEQHIDKAMLQLGSHQLAAAGLLEP